MSSKTEKKEYQNCFHFLVIEDKFRKLHVISQTTDSQEGSTVFTKPSEMINSENEWDTKASILRFHWRPLLVSAVNHDVTHGF